MPEYDKVLEETNVGQILPVGEVVGFVDPSLPAYRIPVNKNNKTREAVVGLKSELDNLGEKQKVKIVK